MNSPLRDMDRHPALPPVPRTSLPKAKPLAERRARPAAVIPTTLPGPRPHRPIGSTRTFLRPIRPVRPLAGKRPEPTEGRVSLAGFLLFVCLGASLFFLAIA